MVRFDRITFIFLFIFIVFHTHTQILSITKIANHKSEPSSLDKDIEFLFPQKKPFYISYMWSNSTRNLIINVTCSIILFSLINRSIYHVGVLFKNDSSPFLSCREPIYLSDDFWTPNEKKFRFSIRYLAHGK